MRTLGTRYLLCDESAVAGIVHVWRQFETIQIENSKLKWTHKQNY